MRKILGLDLGVASIGWAFVQTDDSEQPIEIKGIGSRIIPYLDKEGEDFGKGVGESINQERTRNRTSRKGLDRYQQRRKTLIRLLKSNNMMPEESLKNLSALDLFGLRAKAVNEKIELTELGRILLHLNQRRGYKHGSDDVSDKVEKQERDYVEAINNRYAKIRGQKTIGQFFFEELSEHIGANKYYRIKEQIFPREAYIEEFDALWERQAKEHNQLTNELKRKIRDEVIYYQRPLKSQKDLVSTCEFEGFYTKDKNGKEIFTGPKVAPRSSPLFQLCRIWENINAITIKRVDSDTKKHEVIDISPFKSAILEHLSNSEILTEAKLFDLLKINKSDGYYSDRNIRKKGIQGNKTVYKILQALNGYEKIYDLIRFNLVIENADHVNRQTGEIISIKQISSACEKEPLYQLWHTCYSIKDKEEKVKALEKRFSISREYSIALSKIDFTSDEFSNKSTKTMRKILPSLMNGNIYSTAMELVGYNHSFSESKEENLRRELKKKLSLLQKNELRQPVVEKILNQMINLVNAVIEEHGRPDEIRVELARELKQNKDERNDFFNSINQRTKQNEKIAERLHNEYGVKGSRKNIEKWRLWHEVNGRCLYCNTQISVNQFLQGAESDVEHIIPRSIFFDDSFANKTISHVACNKLKGNMTAFDFMASKGKDHFDTYIKTINDLYKNERSDKAKTDEGTYCLTGKVSKSKFDRLQWRKEDIPNDFINRQLQETRFIARKAKEILNEVCRDVYSTSGKVTERLRRLWGWEDVLMNLSIPKFKEHNLTAIQELNNNGKKQKREIIPDWSKRLDHRHHAIDALTVACTRQGFIQRLNTLNAERTTKEMLTEIEGKEFKEKLSTLDKYLIVQRPFTPLHVEESVSGILISFKAGKRVAAIGTRKIKVSGKKQVVQKGIIVPRGALSEQSVYGKIKTISKDLKKNEIRKYPVKYLFENSDLIFKPKIKRLVKERLTLHNEDIKKSIASLKSNKIYLDTNQTVELSYGTCYSSEVVIKYELGAGQGKLFDGKENEEKAISILNSIVDNQVRRKIEERLFDKAGVYIPTKEALRNLKENPIWFNEEKGIPILSVRCFTGLKAIEPVKRDEKGKEIGFVLTKNNHHIALYKDETGDLVELPSTFWHSVERKTVFLKYLSQEDRQLIQDNTIIKNPKLLWDKLLELSDDTLTQSFLEKIPRTNWEFVISIQQNEMFVIGLTKEELNTALEKGDYKLINQYLYRVQKLATNNYCFRLHIETKVDDKYNGKKNEMLSKALKKLIIIQSLDSWKQRNPIKVRINILGKVVSLADQL